MPSKRSKKVKKRQKALQRWRQRSATTRRPLTQIPPENANQVAMTTTGEIMQLIRHCSKDSGSCISPACLVERPSGLVAVFGTGFSDHVQGNTSL